MPLPVIGASREKDGKGWRIAVEAKGPRENSVLGRWGGGREEGTEQMEPTCAAKEGKVERERAGRR